MLAPQRGQRSSPGGVGLLRLIAEMIEREKCLRLALEALLWEAEGKGLGIGARTAQALEAAGYEYAPAGSKGR